MPRLMSFALTRAQILDGSKTETRRLGWEFLKPGDLFYGVEKAMGLKKGEKPVKLGLFRCVSNVREALNSITPEAVRREGFPDKTPAEFIQMFCGHMRCSPHEFVSSIRFEPVMEEPKAVDHTDELAKYKSSNFGFMDLWNAVDRILDDREYSSRLNQIEALRELMRTKKVKCESEHVLNEVLERDGKLDALLSDVAHQLRTWADADEGAKGGEIRRRTMRELSNRIFAAVREGKQAR